MYYGNHVPDLYWTLYAQYEYHVYLHAATLMIIKKYVLVILSKGIHINLTLYFSLNL